MITSDERKLLYIQDYLWHQEVILEEDYRNKLYKIGSIKKTDSGKINAAYEAKVKLEAFQEISREITRIIVNIR